LPRSFNPPPALLGQSSYWSDRTSKVQQVTKRFETLAGRARLIELDLFINASLKHFVSPAFELYHSFRRGAQGKVRKTGPVRLATKIELVRLSVGPFSVVLAFRSMRQ
jgi:hypothetical protein